MPSLKAVVVDTGVLIKGDCDLQKVAERVFTVQEVVSEVKDENTRRRLQVLPYQLKFKEPSHAAVERVTSFARKTGDYHVLSCVDIKLLALTYQLECELGTNRGQNLRTEPVKVTRPSVSHTQHSASGTIGMYYGPNYDDNSSVAGSTAPSRDPSTASATPSLTPTAVSPTTSLSELPGVSPPPSDREPQVPAMDNDCTAIDHFDEEDELEEDDYGGDWITPNNIQEALKEMGGASSSGSLEGVAVGCITIDYTMQNVLLQMGLHAISIGGLLIRELRCHRMYCKACNRIANHPGSNFCPNCGNSVLIRISYSVGSDGAVHMAPLSSKQFTRRGLKFPLPKPTGGRHASNPITCPDQKLPNQRSAVTTKRKEKVDVFSPEYVARSSPFAVHDVTSKGAVMGFNKRHQGTAGRRNPNAVKQKGKRK